MKEEDLKHVGYWQSKYEPHLPHPRDFVDLEWSQLEREIVIKHLQHGEEAERWRGAAMCRLCEEKLGTCDMTDGVYMWPQKMEHYLIVHNVKPPQDFINHVLTLRA